MIGRLLTSGWRAALRDPLHSLINLVGLALGFAAAILIALFLRYEMSFDRAVPDAERVARLTTTLHLPGRGAMAIAAAGPTVARDLTADFPEIAAGVRLLPETYGVRRGTFEASERVLDADPGVLTFFGFGLAEGDAATALDRPDAVVLSQAAARKYFGSADPLGQSIELGRGHVMQVTGVLKPVPSNSHLELNILVSGRAGFSLMAQQDAMPDPALFNFLTYVKLKPGASLATVAGGLPAFFERHPPLPADQMAAVQPVLAVQPLLDVHLHSLPMAELKPGIAVATLWAFGAVGALILVVASINFVTLLSARAGRRAVEVGVRKAAGASRMQLALQFLVETLIQAAAAMILAVALAELALPGITAYLGRPIDFAYWRDPVIGLSLLGMVGCVGLVAGLYPALVLSSFRPAMVLKGGVAAGHASALRQGLVVLQFTISIGLIVATLVIADQTSFARKRSLAVGPDPVLLIGNLGSPFPRESLEALRNRIQALPGVRAIAASAEAPTDYSTSYATVETPGHPQEAPVSLFVDPADPSFFTVYGLRPLAGRVLLADKPGDDPTDSGPVVLTREAARMLGFASPEAAIDQPILIGAPQNTKVQTIIGVVPDFPIKSVRDGVEPLAFSPMRASYGTLSVKIRAEAVAETVGAIDRIWNETVADRPIRRAFLDERMAALYRDMERESRMFTAFAGLSVLVGCLGLFALSSYAAEQRTKEVGIRKALGASTSQIIRLLVWDLVKPVLLANLIAWPSAWWVMRHWLDGFAWRIDLGAAPFVSAGAATAAIALLTTLAHAVQVGRARPVTALRYE